MRLEAIVEAMKERGETEEYIQEVSLSLSYFKIALFLTSNSNFADSRDVNAT